MEFMTNFNSQAPAFTGLFRFNEPLADHTTFKVGGPADLWIRPEGAGFPAYAAALLEAAGKGGIPVFILGGGANLVVSDRGIRGIVLDTTGYAGVEDESEGVSEGEGLLRFRAGTTVDRALEEAAARSCSGLEFLAGMPGSIGGALWMNARCYDREIADVITGVRLLEGGRILTMTQDKKDYGYKKSPFQGRSLVILGGVFSVTKKDPAFIREEMESRRKDREKKGHYRFPSAGSAFKNNREFGKPTGKIIDELGLRGLSRGDAQIAPWHGNLIINRGRARAGDIRALLDEVQERVHTALGFTLEPEIIFTGEGF
jgi:UDP-N-acetylmuramate dehydrogenase